MQCQVYFLHSLLTMPSTKCVIKVKHMANRPSNWPRDENQNKIILFYYLYLFFTLFLSSSTHQISSIYWLFFHFFHQFFFFFYCLFRLAGFLLCGLTECWYAPIGRVLFANSWNNILVFESVLRTGYCWWRLDGK